MIRKIFLIAACTLFLGYGSMAQDNTEKNSLKNAKILENMSIPEYYRTYHSRKPNAELMEKLKNSIPAEEVKSQQKSEKGLKMPEKFWLPGEFEEVQAILITWSYIHVDNSISYYAIPINKDTAFWYDDKDIIRVGRYKSFIDVDDDESRFPIISAQVADAIQQGGAQVWINIVNPSDSTVIKNYMAKKGMPLKNYRFFIAPNNSFWYRDCGPVAFYYGNRDSIAFLDFEYYTGRPADDMVPIHLGKALNIPVYTTTVKYEGGNIILDGAGTLFTSDEVYNGNSPALYPNYGQYYLDGGVLKRPTRAKLSKQQVNDSLTLFFGLDRIKALPRLRYDGGTGHIDLYAAMWDENNFVFTKYPEEMSNQIDYTISSKNVDTILSMVSFHGKKYRSRNIPLPRKDDNTWYKDNVSNPYYPTYSSSKYIPEFELYTRTYSNSTFVNDVIIQPIFSDDKWGAREWDLQAIEQMKKAFPGYKIIPIDIRGYENDKSLSTGFDGTGGAIHCITKQIPAENPIRILHAPIQDFVDDNVYNGNFPISATITNKSGIASATCFWRVKGANSWQSLSLTKGADNIFSNILSHPATLKNDTVEYYITATSNNGKTITKPMTAPNGFYSFYHGTEFVPATNITGIPTGDTVGSLTLMGEVIPGIATNKTITWSVVEQGGTDATIIDDNILNTTATGTVTVRATIINGTAIGTDYTKDFDIAISAVGDFVPVTDITNLPNTATAETMLTLTVVPSNATNQTVTWSIVDQGDTDATIIDGNTLNTTVAGLVTIRATIEDGTAEGSNYTKDFEIRVAPAFVAVTNITDVPLTVGTPLMLSGTVIPNNATNQTISWSIVKQGGTGATISDGNILNATATGTVIVRATVVNGTAVGTNYTKDLNITITSAFVAVTNITDVPATTTVEPPLILTGTVIPNNATNQTISWSVVNQGGTGATIIDSLLSVTATGIVTVKATITNGKTTDTDYEQDFQITVTDGTGIAEAMQKTSNIKIYPNPVSGKLYIQTNSEIIPEVKLFSIDGRILQYVRSTEIDMSKYTAGIYFVQIEGKTLKVIKK